MELVLISYELLRTVKDHLRLDIDGNRRRHQVVDRGIRSRGQDERELKDGDVAIIMGAGDVWKVFERLDLK